jgi:hypothetical protein
MTIELHLTRDGWMARHSGPGSEVIAELFGTRDIPTAFTAAAAGSAVLGEIRRLNPEADVILAV